MSYFPQTVFLFIVALIGYGFLPKSIAEQSPDVFVVGNYLVSEGGSWNPKDGPLRGPFGIDFDGSGVMYIIELSRGCLHRRTDDGRIETLRSEHPKGYGGDGKPVSKAQFNGPHNCVATADGRLLIADSWNHCVRAVDLESLEVSTIAGNGVAGFSGDGGPATNAEFDYTMSIALDPSGTTLHIADLKNRRVRNMDLTSGRVETVAGTGKRAEPVEGQPAADNPLVDPRAAASDHQGNLYILERSANCLRVVRKDGTIHTVAGTGERGWRDGDAAQALFGSPKHLCCDPEGNVYIADDLNGAIRKFDPRTRRVSTVLGRGHGASRVTLKNPHGVQWHEGTLYVVDTGNARILRLSPEPLTTTPAKAKTSSGKKQ